MVLSGLPIHIQVSSNEIPHPGVIDEDVLNEVGGKLHVQQYLPAQDVGPSQGVIGQLVESLVGAGDIPLFMKWVSNWTRVLVHMLYVHQNSS